MFKREGAQALSLFFANAPFTLLIMRRNYYKEVIMGELFVGMLVVFIVVPVVVAVFATALTRLGINTVNFVRVKMGKEKLPEEVWG